MKMKLTENFNLRELTKSQVAERRGIPNNPSSDHIDALKKLCESVLQPIRNHYESPVIISSGYRSGELCIVDNKELGTWIKNNIDYDQLILEFYKEGEPTSGWIHVSYVGKANRKSTLIAYKDANGKTQYKPW
jgi:zinc D-Ala-D-Ala carboxypeptidase